MKKIKKKPKKTKTKVGKKIKKSAKPIKKKVKKSAKPIKKKVKKIKSKVKSSNKNIRKIKNQETPKKQNFILKIINFQNSLRPQIKFKINLSIENTSKPSLIRLPIQFLIINKQKKMKLDV